MKFLLVHNFYQQRGGEDQVFADEGALLQSHGHEVLRYTLHNDALTSMSPASAACRTVWNHEAYRELRLLVQRERPALVHFTNTFPLLSPAAYYAVKKYSAAVVQSLHNYRLLCAGATLLRDGVICERCVGRLAPWLSVRHKCYRGSRSASLALSAMVILHRFLGTWRTQVDRYIALTEFARDKFVQGGISAERLAVKPNFMFHDPGPGAGQGGYALFVGRLSPEKGVATLLTAWARNRNLPTLKIAGHGPMANAVRRAATNDPRIEWLGPQPSEAVLRWVGDAAMLVFPSLWYEGMPKTIVESFCRGTPVIAARLGAMAEMIEAGRTGEFFDVADAGSLATTVERLAADITRQRSMRVNVRAEFMARYTAAIGYHRLIDVYVDALRHCGQHELAQQLQGGLHRAPTEGVSALAPGDAEALPIPTFAAAHT